MNTKPKKIFIGSSRESLSQAKVIKSYLESDCGAIAEIWDTQFPAGEVILSKLEGLLENYNGAVFIFAPNVDCVVRGRNEKHPMHNVVFEAGMFIGRIGSTRVAIVKHEGVDIYSDISGLIYIRIQAYPGEKQACQLMKEAREQLKKWVALLP